MRLNQVIVVPAPPKKVEIRCEEDTIENRLVDPYVQPAKLVKGDIIDAEGFVIDQAEEHEASLTLLLEQAHVIIRLMLDEKFRWNGQYFYGVKKDALKLEKQLHAFFKALEEEKG